MELELRVVSDLHLEFENLYLPELPGDDGRVLILAGDLGLSRKRYSYLPFLKAVHDQFRSVVWIFGNHEYYKDSICKSRVRVMETLAAEGVADNIHILENESVMVDDTAILGATLWTDIDHSNPVTIAAVQDGLSDYAQIRTGPANDPHKRKLTAKNTISLHKASKAWLIEESQLQKSRGKKIVVVTHHLPLYESIPAELQREPLNPGYASNMDREMADIGAELWIHGHTHYSCDYRAPCGTRVICNPRGYAGIGENRKFDSKLIVKV